jgi:hypothetical protein
MIKPDRCSESGLWILQFYTPEQQNFQLQSIEFESPIATLYENVVFESSQPDSSPTRFKHVCF